MALLTSCMQRLRVNHASSPAGANSISACLFSVYTTTMQILGQVCQSVVDTAQEGCQVAPFSHISRRIV